MNAFALKIGKKNDSFFLLIIFYLYIFIYIYSPLDRITIRVSLKDFERKYNNGRYMAYRDRLAGEPRFYVSRLLVWRK